MPRFLYGVPCLATPAEVNAPMGRLGRNEMAPFILKSGMLFAFQNMERAGNPFSVFVPGRSAEKYSAKEW